MLSDAEVREALSEASAPVIGSAADYARGVLGAMSAPASLALRSPTSVPPPPPAAERSQWERISLTPDLELHLRRPLSREQNKLVERLLAHARRLLEEDAP